MGKLIVLQRPGMQIVSGTVVSSDGDSVLIEGELCDGIKERIRIRSKLIEKMTIKTDMTLIASVRATHESLDLADGLCVPGKEVVVEAYFIRFTGAFDFEQRGTEKEAHVFCGNVMDNRPVRAGGRKITVSWKRNNYSETRLLYCPEDFQCENGKRAVFVTGPKSQTKSGSDVYLVHDAFLA